MSPSSIPSLVTTAPFSLSDDAAYAEWRAERLQYRLPTLDDLLVEVIDPYHLSESEKSAIIERCDSYNMAIYQLSDPGILEKSQIHAIGDQLQLRHIDANIRSDDDSVSSLEVREQVGNNYIPYTNKALSWHTDGYYNRLDKQIYGIIMYCVRPAAEGGVNSLLNPEQLYITLRDEDPAYIEALMHPQAMTIPDNVESGEVIRAEQSGPVFSIKADGRLHMRYSARKRNIIWRDTPATQKAVDKITRVLADDKNVFKVGLEAGQGIICNNVLHNRSAFVDSETRQRLIYRARYYDAIG